MPCSPTHFAMAAVCLLSLATSLVTPHAAEACQPPQASTNIIQSTIPTNELEDVPIQTPIGLKWETVSSGLDTDFNLFDEPSILVRKQGSDVVIQGAQQNMGLNALVFRPDALLEPSSVYDVVVVNPSRGSDTIIHEWSFRTASEDTQPNPITFEGVIDVNAAQFAQRTFTYCLEEDTSECGGQGVHTGWAYPIRTTIEVQGVQGSSFGEGYYHYKLYRHASVDTPMQRSPAGYLHSGGSINQLMHDTSQDTSEEQFCYSLVAFTLDDPNVEIPSARGITCVDFQEGLYDPEPEPGQAGFVCEGGEGGEFEEIEVEVEGPGDPTRRNEPTEQPVDPRDEDAMAFCGGCASTPAQGGSMALLWLIPALVMRLRRRRTTRLTI